MQKDLLFPLKNLCALMSSSEVQVYVQNGKKGRNFPESRAMNYGEQWTRELFLAEKVEPNEQRWQCASYKSRV